MGGLKAVSKHFAKAMKLNRNGTALATLALRDLSAGLSEHKVLHKHIAMPWIQRRQTLIQQR